MGFWKQVFVDKHEWERQNRRREERGRARELEFQRKYVYLTLPERLKRLANDREKLKAAAYKLTGQDLDDYVGPHFSDAVYRINRNGGRIVSSHSSGGGCGYSPSIKRDYDQEDAEAHERYVDSVCAAARGGRILRMVEDARFDAKRHH